MNSQSSLRAFFKDLRKKRIIEILAAFVGGGWLLVEVVERLLVGHYKFPEETIDLTVVSVVGALLATLVWRWFCGRDKRPGNIKFEVLFAPLILLATVTIDLVIVLKIIDVPGKPLLVAAAAVCLGIAWIVLKSLQWAAAAAPLIAPGLVPTSEKPLNPVPTPPEKSIIVLPFENISPDPEQDYFCDGMTEEIITDLSHVNELLVISRSSAMTFKGTKQTIPEIARAVNVHYIMEGSVRKAGNDLRITAQLIDAVTDAHIWAGKYSGTLDDVFDIQEKVSWCIVDALKLKLNTMEQQQIAQRPMGSVAAYECYLKAYHQIYLFTKESIDQGIMTLQNGLEILGENARLYATLGEAYYLYFDVGIETDEAVLKKAEEYARKALAVQPDSAHGYKLLGLLERGHGNLIQAYRYMNHAYRIDPHDAGIMLYTGSFLAWYAGRPALANPIFKKLLEIDPLTSVNYLFMAIVSYSQKQCSRSIELTRKALQMNPEFSWLKFWLAYYLAADGQKSEALNIADHTIGDQAVDTIMKQLLLFLKYALGNDYEKAKHTLNPETKKYIWNDPDFSALMPGLFSSVDEKEEAFRYMEHALARGFINYPFYAENDTFLANLRKEARFKKLMERVKYDWEHFEE